MNTAKELIVKKRFLAERLVLLEEILPGQPEEVYRFAKFLAENFLDELSTKTQNLEKQLGTRIDEKVLRFFDQDPIDSGLNPFGWGIRSSLVLKEIEPEDGPVKKAVKPRLQTIAKAVVSEEFANQVHF